MNIEHEKARRKQYYQEHKEECKARMRSRGQKIKNKVLAAYCDDEIIKCKKCSEDDVRILTLDHVNGGGGKHRSTCRENGTNVYDDLIKNNFPEGFQILCPNCNHAKRCDNNENRVSNGKETEIQRRYHSKLRMDLIAAYSDGLNRCNKCGTEDIRLLCVDHVNGDGGNHRRKVGDIYSTWRDLKKRGYPDGIQILCHNSNRRKMHDNNEFATKKGIENKNAH
jgi:hypothetical protein